MTVNPSGYAIIHYFQGYNKDMSGSFYAVMYVAFNKVVDKLHKI